MSTEASPRSELKVEPSGWFHPVSPRSGWLTAGSGPTYLGMERLRVSELEALTKKRLTDDFGI